MVNTVLVVDDSKENVDGLRSILDNEYKVMVALGGEKALEIMEKHKPDMVLLDVYMPGLNGMDVLERMRDNPALENIPVIFITGASDSYNEKRGLMLGAVDYISKPYDADVVAIKVRNHLANKNNRDNLERLVEIRTQALSDSHKAVILGMSLLAEGRDGGTGAHIQRMQKYTEILAKYINKKHPQMLSESEMKKTVLYAPLHDIGKVCISDSILLKPGKLTQEEYETIKYHTVFGTKVLRETQHLLTMGNSTLRVAMEICEGHHEKYDGSGYPNGLAGEDIPISARIVALADIYDALTSAREYKPAFSHKASFDIIVNGDGRTLPQHFAPEVMDAFLACVDDFEDYMLKARELL
ncbi:MAG: response regulator [Oscillospiraceae bacterium]|nr:response regulator [Oscillospiraceae bacterium]